MHISNKECSTLDAFLFWDFKSSLSLKNDGTKQNFLYSVQCLCLCGCVFGPFLFGIMYLRSILHPPKVPWSPKFVSMFFFLKCYSCVHCLRRVQSHAVWSFIELNFSKNGSKITRRSMNCFFHCLLSALKHQFSITCYCIISYFGKKDVCPQKKTFFNFWGERWNIFPPDLQRSIREIAGGGDYFFLIVGVWKYRGGSHNWKGGGSIHVKTVVK